MRNRYNGMMKRTWIYILGLMLGILLCGCGKGKEAPAGESAPDSKPAGTVVEETQETRDQSLVGIWDCYDREYGIYTSYDLKDDGTGTYTMNAGGDDVVYELKYTVKDGHLLVRYVNNDTFSEEDEFDSEFRIEDQDTVVIKDSFGMEMTFMRRGSYDPAEFQGSDESAEPAQMTVGGSDEAAADGTLPAYEYTGPELFYSVLYQYLIDELGKDYDKSQVSIPCPVIVKEDESDKSDIRVYGNFWIFNYDLNGDILENTSGGSYPGCIHVKDTGEDYVVTSMEVVEDGAGFTESAKKIFGEYYDLFMKAGEDENLREKTRARIIADYVEANDLNITAYQDYGWDPVPLPKEE